jgi:hypothetical protein
MDHCAKQATPITVKMDAKYIDSPSNDKFHINDQIVTIITLKQKFKIRKI